MLQEEIVVGRAYVNEGACTIREVIAEMDHRHLKYVAFELESGRLLPARHCVCSARDMQRWAEREAQPHEMARIHPFHFPWGFDEPSLTRPPSARHEGAGANADAMPGAHSFPKLI